MVKKKSDNCIRNLIKINLIFLVKKEQKNNSLLTLKSKILYTRRE